MKVHVIGSRARYFSPSESVRSRRQSSKIVPTPEHRSQVSSQVSSQVGQLRLRLHLCSSLTHSVDKDVNVRVVDEHGECGQDFLKHGGFQGTKEVKFPNLTNRFGL